MGWQLDGKVAFVTGGSKGIGQAIAIGLAKAGAAVALTGRSDGAGPGTARATAALIEAMRGRALPLVCDVGNAEEVMRCVDAAVAAFGRLDILVNNAGVYYPGHGVTSIDLALWDETIATHIRGTFLCSRYAIPHMIAAGGGSIINMSSTAGDPVYGSAGNVAYAVAKAGIEQFTRGLARELVEHDIAVNAIRPMALLSEGSQAAHAGTDKLKNFSPPSAICPAIEFLAQQRAGFSGKVVRRTDFEEGSFRTIVTEGLDQVQ